MPTPLQKRDLARHERRFQVYEATRRQLRASLAELIPGHKVILFGSLTKLGVFNDQSDIDLAIETEPAQMDSWRLISELMDRLDRPVDLVLLKRCRFRDKILREGEVWTA